jgi:hypothetical protein
VPFLDLGDGWALSADRNQWILNKAKTVRGKVKWQPKAFVGSDTAVLRRVMREKGLRVPPDASDAVNRFLAVNHGQFVDWRDKIEALRRRRAG